MRVGMQLWKRKSDLTNLKASLNLIQDQICSLFGPASAADVLQKNVI